MGVGLGMLRESRENCARTRSILESNSRERERIGERVVMGSSRGRELMRTGRRTEVKLAAGTLRDVGGAHAMIISIAQIGGRTLPQA